MFCIDVCHLGVGVLSLTGERLVLSLTGERLVLSLTGESLVWGLNPGPSARIDVYGCSQSANTSVLVSMRGAGHVYIPLVEFPE